ncbi:hypothetical protein CBS147353_11593 [Aspergillus niger]|nr:hypothetical protein CBS147353_11593 [Aspergillus niger]GAA93208.1 zinc knuckle domain protein [Aspergillus luchuensis IFO 4308]
MAIPPADDPEITPRTPENSARNNGEQTLAPAHRGRTRRTQNITIPPLDFNAPDDTSNRITNQMVWALILSLKKTITHQNIAIESARAEIQEIKAGQEDLRKENTKLQEEIQSLRSQIETQTLPSPKSWAAVAAAAAGNRPEQSSNVIIPRPWKEPNCVRISTAATLDEDIDNERFTRFLPTEAANTHIRTALLNAEITKEVQVAGVGTTKTGYVIRFQDAQSAETA